MNREQLGTTIRKAVESYIAPSRAGTLGRPFSAAKVAAEVDRLRAALQEPTRAVVHFDGGTSRECWLVTREVDGYIVLYDEGRDLYDLAERTADGLRSINVPGDLVGTFMAR